MDRVKEALFSILGSEIINKTVLDLFAGTGAVGIEALSRGAAHVTFLDIEKPAIQTIYENLKTTQLIERATVRRADSFAYLKTTPPAPFDFIYVAPPQYKDMWKQAITLIDAHAQTLLAEDSSVIVQIDPREFDESITLEHLVEYDVRVYGNTMLWFLTPATDDDNDEEGLEDDTE
jgi:16S rRNA (guanine(966)-N(2))-methyltransferase RsmD